MSNKVKDIHMKNLTPYFFNNNTNIKNFDPHNIKIDEKSYNIIFIYYSGYVTIKDSKYVKICTLFSETQMDALNKLIEVSI